ANDGFLDSATRTTTVSLIAQDRIGVFRPNSNQWFLDQQNVNYSAATTNQIDNFGQPGDIAVVGDWLGDGRQEVGVFRASSHQWFLSKTNTNYTVANTIQIDNFGQDGDVPVVGRWGNNPNLDYIGVFRPSTGQWFLNK